MSPLLVHAHIPKTAGSALNRGVLLPRFKAENAALIYGVAFERSRRLPGDAQIPSEPAFLSGHVPYGYAEALRRDVIYVSVLRDPVDRLISFLNYVALADRHGARRQFEEDMKAVARRDPVRFVEQMLQSDLVRLRQSNIMVRLASGMPRLSKKTPGRWRLAQARRNVARGDYLVGAQENFYEFERLLRLTVDESGIGDPAGAAMVPRSEQLEKRLEKVIRREDMPSGVIDRIRAENVLDQRLYDFVAERVAKGMLAA
ncbi:MAG: hypothetical protein AAF401_10805 [Pseudomonadota bacterium]